MAHSNHDRWVLDKGCEMGVFSSWLPYILVVRLLPGWVPCRFPSWAVLLIDIFLEASCFIVWHLAVHFQAGLSDFKGRMKYSSDLLPLRRRGSPHVAQGLAGIPCAIFVLFLVGGIDPLCLLSKMNFRSSASIVAESWRFHSHLFSLL